MTAPGVLPGSTPTTSRLGGLEDSVRKTTINELGYRLPVGAVLPTGERTRAFAFGKWSMSTELALGKLRDQNRAMSAGTFAAHVLARMLTEWCGRSLQGVSEPERMLMLNRSWAGDVYHAWFQLRRRVIGNELEMRIVCGMCRKGFDYGVDLGTVEVFEHEDGDELRAPFQFSDGVDYKGEQRDVATTEPLRWAVYEGLGDDGMNIAAMKLAIVRNATVGLSGVAPDVPLSPEWADDLSKLDFERMSAFINERQPGPSLQIETACPKCSSPVTRSISWTYDSFFSVRTSGAGGVRTS